MSRISDAHLAVHKRRTKLVLRGQCFKSPFHACSSSESGTGETRVAATGVGVEFAGKQRKIRSRKYEGKAKNRGTIKMVVQAIMVASRSQ
jgi:hypothetical protein